MKMAQINGYFTAKGWQAVMKYLYQICRLHSVIALFLSHS
jgi:hypothetical protein